MVSVGRLITAVVTKFGFCSQKAAVRIATETGMKMIDESRRLGRNLNTSEVESIFKANVPRGIRPKILTSQEETAKQMIERGMSEEKAREFIANENVLGCALTMGRKKAPIFVKTDAPILEQIEQVGGDSAAFSVSTITHELEHALEYNGRLSKTLQRRFIYPIKLAFKKDKKAYIDGLNAENLKFQIAMQEHLPSVPEQEFEATARGMIENLSKGSRKLLKLYKNSLKLEIPAYTAGSNVEKYVGEGSIPQFQGIVGGIYRKVAEILKDM